MESNEGGRKETDLSATFRVPEEEAKSKARFRDTQLNQALGPALRFLKVINFSCSTEGRTMECFPQLIIQRNLHSTGSLRTAGMAKVHALMIVNISLQNGRTIECFHQLMLSSILDFYVFTSSLLTSLYYTFMANSLLLRSEPYFYWIRYSQYRFIKEIQILKQYTANI